MLSPLLPTSFYVQRQPVAIPASSFEEYLLYKHSIEDYLRRSNKTLQLVAFGRALRDLDALVVPSFSQGSGGGPSENDVTGLLVRSTTSKWAKGSILAVDAGSHLASITSILSKHFPLVAPAPTTSSTTESDSGSAEPDFNEPQTTILTSGPFAGCEFPHASARANSVYVVREHVSTYLITHPHLDHLSGFVINTASFHNTSRPKRLAALPFTVNAIKNNIFNDVIWPNLTDEDNGVGFVTFQRLTDRGNVALGDGDSKGYIEVCDGLSAKGFKVSHGMCASKPIQPTSATLPDPLGRRASLPTHEGTSWITHGVHHNGLGSPGKHPDTPGRRSSIYTQGQPPTPTPSILAQQPGSLAAVEHSHVSCVVDSSAFFIRAENEAAPGQGKEILVWGDVEPDSISALPRNHIVWGEAAPKIVSGVLKAVFIECSYSDVQGDAVLFGHLAPRHVIQELMNLADMVSESRRRDSLGSSGESQRTSLRDGERDRDRKRKRMSMGTAGPSAPVAVRSAMQAVEEETRNGVAIALATASPGAAGKSRRRTGSLLLHSTPMSNSLKGDDHDHDTDPLSTYMDTEYVPDSAVRPPPQTAPLDGFTVVIIHVKDTLTDGPLVGDLILSDLLEHESLLVAQGRPLGCKFIVSKRGESYLF